MENRQRQPKPDGLVRRMDLWRRSFSVPDRQSLAAITQGLQGRLFGWTFLFVICAEVLLLVPSMGMFYRTWLGERINTAQIAVLVHDASADAANDDGFEMDLLEKTGVSAIILRRGSSYDLLYVSEDPSKPDLEVDLNDHGTISSIQSAFGALFAPAGRTIHLLGPALETGETVEIMFPEAPLKGALWGHCLNILWLSLLIALLTASSVYWVVYKELVRPIRSLISNMTAFRQHPEDATLASPELVGRGELAEAADTLHDMQTELRAALNQKNRLAALGTAVSKINHDLRNVLASAQLITDRLASSADPTVQRIAPQLVRSIDRAVTLCSDTLRFGRAEDPPPLRQWFELTVIAEDVRNALNLGPDGDVDWEISFSKSLRLYADPDHVFRSLLNLARNAVQAIKSVPDRKDRGKLTLSARLSDMGGQRSIILDLEDNGPGIPETVRDRLFQAFVTAARAGGTGLGLAIAQDLTRAQGGNLILLESTNTGTVFRLTLPQPQMRAPPEAPADTPKDS